MSLGQVDAADETPDRFSASAQQIRGSTVLFAGRLLSLGLQTATQVLIVRLLTKADYGAFAYALAIVASARSLISFGHGHVLTRFFSLYDEERAYGKLAGTIVMEAATVLAAGLFLFVGVLGLQDVLVGSVIDDERAIEVLAVLILLAPLEGLDRVFEAIFAVFGRARAIVFRKYVLVPLLRLLLVLMLFATEPSVTALTYGYVAIGAFGIVVYALMTGTFFRQRGLLGYFRPRALVMPFREVWGFAFPLLSNELVNISMWTVSIAILGHYWGTVVVADYRAIFPAARLNYMVYFTFGLLFMPLATRLHRRGDQLGMRDAYWQTAAWLTVFSFPLFALTGPLAEPTTVFLFGERYEGSAVFLALLSVGYYFSTAFGFNSLTLRAYGMLRYIVGVNVAVALANVVASIALIPRHGALGVAIANAAALVLLNVLSQIGLRQAGLPPFDLRYARIYLSVAALAGALAVVQLTLSPPFAVGVVLAAVASLALLATNRRLLDIKSTYPEFGSIPVLRHLVS